MASLRTFIAIEIPDNIRQQIVALQTELKTLGGKITWVRPENLHLTLKFLGDTDEDIIETIIEKLSDIISGFAEFEITSKGVGVFPNWKRARIIWLGTSGADEILKKLVQQINQQLIDFGFEPEKRPFSGHLTLGRVRDSRGLEPVLKRIEQTDCFEAGKFLATDILFIKSVLTSQGPIYTPLKKIKIK